MIVGFAGSICVCDLMFLVVILLSLASCLVVQGNLEAPLPLAEIERLLENHYQLIKSQCGTSNWQEEYTKQHNAIMQSPNPRILVAIPNLSGKNIISFILFTLYYPIFLGLADRIIGFSTTCMIAILTNRAFQVGQRSGLPPISPTFYSPYLNWTRSGIEPDWVIEPLKYKAKIRNFNESILSTGLYNAVNTIEDYRLLDRLLRENLEDLMHRTAATTFLAINRGKTIRMFENKHHVDKLTKMGLKPETAFGCFVNYLIKPNSTIFTHFPASTFQLLATPSPTILKIGLQIRAGDRYMGMDHIKLSVEDYWGFFDCAQQIETMLLYNASNPASNSSSKYTKAIWYLVTDVKSLREAAVSHFGNEKIITSLTAEIEHSSKEESVCKKGVCGHVSNDGFNTAAAEWWMLSMVNYYVISRYSGYGRSAAMHGLQSDHIYTIPYGKERHTITCNQQTKTDLETIAWDWSGI
jgi:hypothetical protein